MTVKQCLNADSGFTLVELMVAMLVLTVGLLGMLGAAATTIRVIGEGDRTVGAAYHASGRIDELTALGALGFYVSYQHWWSDVARSSAIYGMVTVDNEDSQDEFAFRRTHRLTGNFIVSPKRYFR